MIKRYISIYPLLFLSFLSTATEKQTKIEEYRLLSDDAAVVTFDATIINESTAILNGELSGDVLDETEVYFKYRAVGTGEEETWWMIADTHIGSHRDNEENPLENLEAAVADVNELGISQYAIVLGDLVHDDPVFVEPYENAMNQLNHEWIDVLGNHDFDRRGTGKRVKERTFFSREIGGVRFIAISDDGKWEDGDAVEAYQTETNLRSDQDAWFRAELDSDPDKPTVLWSHQGLRRHFVIPDSDDGPCFWDPRRRGWLQYNLGKYNLIAWIHGHHHAWAFEENYQDLGYVMVSPRTLASNTGGGIFMTVRYEDNITTMTFRFRHHLSGEWIEVAGKEEHVITVEHGWSMTMPQMMIETGSFSQILEGLDPDKSYEFKAVVRQKGEENSGEVRPLSTSNACFIVTPYVLKADQNSALISWVSPSGAGAAQVQVQLAGGGGEQTVAGSTSGLSFQDEVAGQLDYVRNFVELQELQPFSEYEYTVGCANGMSQSGRFKTAPHPDDTPEISFIVIADGDVESGRQTMLAEAAAAEQADFVVHAGGYTGTSDQDWERWLAYFNTSRAYLSSGVFWPVGSGDGEGLAQNYHSLFSFEAEPADDETWYSFDYGNVQFLAFDFSRDLAPQISWAEQELSARQSDWKIAFWHHTGPNIGGSGNMFGTSEEKQLGLLMEGHGVDLVVHGGGRIYERKWPLGGAGSKPVHYISLNSGSEFHVVRPGPVIEGGIGQQEHVFIRFHIDGNELEMKAINLEGEMVDQLALVKESNGMYQPEVMARAVDLDTAMELAHIYTGQSLSEDLRFERRDLAGKLSLDAPFRGWRGADVNLMLNTELAGQPDITTAGFPAGSELLILEKSETEGWQTEEQSMVISDSLTEIKMTAPSNFVPGSSHSTMELSVNVRYKDREFEPVRLQPALPMLSAVDLVSPLMAEVSTKPDFAWKEEPGALAYRFQVSSTFFRTTLDDTIVIGADYNLPFHLDELSTYRWRVSPVHIHAGPWSEGMRFFTRQYTGTEVSNNLPSEFKLGINYPNPFNPSTTIQYELPVDARVKLTVFDILGREVAVLIHEERTVGIHNVTFDSRSLASGVYHYRIEATPLTGSGQNRFTQSRSMMLIK